MKPVNALVLLPKNGMPVISRPGTRPKRAVVALQAIWRNPMDNADGPDPRFVEAHHTYRQAGFSRTRQALRLLAVA